METICFKHVNDCNPIFAKQKGKLVGMIVKEDKGWVLRLGKAVRATGHYGTLIGCIKSCTPHNYTFFVDQV